MYIDKPRNAIRTLEWNGFLSFLKKVEGAYTRGAFKSHNLEGKTVERTEAPYTPHELIVEIQAAHHALTAPAGMNMNIAVWYTIEQALYYSRLGYDNITLLVKEHNETLMRKCEEYELKYFIYTEINEGSFMKKFDLVIGNPPFSKRVESDNTTKGKSVQLWPEFVRNSLKICKEGGFVSLIHPNGWRAVGDPHSLWAELTQKQIRVVRMYNLADAHDLFGISLKFDNVIIENVKGDTMTKITDSDGVTYNINLAARSFLPTAKIKEIDNLVAKSNEEAVELLNDSTYHHQNIKNMSRMRNEKFKHPCVWSVTKKGEVKLWYSVKNTAHFGTAKLIFANGVHATYIDTDGRYGLMEFTKGIVDTPENLVQIKAAMDSPKFIKLMKAAGCNKNSYDHKLLKLFRKDFWKEFV